MATTVRKCQRIWARKPTNFTICRLGVGLLDFRMPRAAKDDEGIWRARNLDGLFANIKCSRFGVFFAGPSTIHLQTMDVGGNQTVWNPSHHAAILEKRARSEKVSIRMGCILDPHDLNVGQFPANWISSQAFDSLRWGGQTCSDPRNS